MKWEKESVEKELSVLREQLQVDVAAVSWRRARDSRWEWWAASGCRDERFRALSIRVGRGIEGAVPRIGRTLVIDGEHPDSGRQREDSALMHVEQLIAAIACPIVMKDIPQGVLLAGVREERVFSKEQLRSAQQFAARLGQAMQTMAREEKIATLDHRQNNG